MPLTRNQLFRCTGPETGAPQVHFAEDNGSVRTRFLVSA